MYDRMDIDYMQILLYAIFIQGARALQVLVSSAGVVVVWSHFPMETKEGLERAV